MRGVAPLYSVQCTDCTVPFGQADSGSAVQVAAYADRHILVEKGDDAGRATTGFTPLLDAASRTAEVASMLDLDHSVARQLLDSAQADIGASQHAAAAPAPEGGHAGPDADAGDRALASRAAAPHAGSSAQRSADAALQSGVHASGSDGEQLPFKQDASSTAAPFQTHADGDAASASPDPAAPAAAAGDVGTAHSASSGKRADTPTLQQDAQHGMLAGAAQHDAQAFIAVSPPLQNSNGLQDSNGQADKRASAEIDAQAWQLMQDQLRTNTSNASDTSDPRNDDEPARSLGQQSRENSPDAHADQSKAGARCSVNAEQAVLASFNAR